MMTLASYLYQLFSKKNEKYSAEILFGISFLIVVVLRFSDTFLLGHMRENIFNYLVIDSVISNFILRKECDSPLKYIFLSIILFVAIVFEHTAFLWVVLTYLITDFYKNTKLKGVINILLGIIFLIHLFIINESIPFYNELGIVFKSILIFLITITFLNNLILPLIVISILGNKLGIVLDSSLVNIATLILFAGFAISLVTNLKWLESNDVYNEKLELVPLHPLIYILSISSEHALLVFTSLIFLNYLTVIKNKGGSLPPAILLCFALTSSILVNFSSLYFAILFLLSMLGLMLMTIRFKKLIEINIQNLKVDYTKWSVYSLYFIFLIFITDNKEVFSIPILIGTCLGLFCISIFFILSKHNYLNFELPIFHASIPIQPVKLESKISFSKIYEELSSRVEFYINGINLFYAKVESQMNPLVYFSFILVLVFFTMATVMKL